MHNVILPHQRILISCINDYNRTEKANKTGVKKQHTEWKRLEYPAG